MTTATIIGVDLSLTATGFAVKISGEVTHHTISTKQTGMERLDKLVELVNGKVADTDFVVMEDLAFSRNAAGAKENAGLAYLVRWHLYKRGISYLLVPPTTLKKFVTGKGNAEKSLMLLEVYKRFGVSAANDNEADAVGLLYIGLAFTGQWEPTTDAQREVLATLRGETPKKAKKRAAIGAAKEAKPNG